jgi:hypothetical protein
MTAIAIQSGVVVCDTQLTGGNYAVRVEKAVRLPDGSVACAAGEWRKGYAGLSWLQQGQQGQAPDIEGATIAIVSADGSIQIAEGAWPPYPISETELALGCAQDLIRAHLSEGDDPLMAVAKACRDDLLSSAPLLRIQAEQAEFSAPTLHEVAVQGKTKAKATAARKRKRG